MIKNAAFTLSIFVVVALALIFPQAFSYIGDYKTTGLIVPLLMIIMFGMGTSVGVFYHAVGFRNVFKLDCCLLRLV